MRCGWRLGDLSVALDAAHIRWVQADGPDEERNGLALCVLHHKLFDLGAFTLGPDGRVLVSEQAHGGDGFEDSLLRHHDRPARRPQRPEWYPNPRVPGMARPASLQGGTTAPRVTLFPQAQTMGEKQPPPMMPDK